MKEYELSKCIVSYTARRGENIEEEIGRDLSGRATKFLALLNSRHGNGNQVNYK
jgi:hypothetical protein